MKWTDRFIKVPTKEYNVKHKELTGHEILRDSFENINPLDISSYRPACTDEEPDMKYVTISLKNGNSTLAYLSIEQFEDLMNNRDQI